MYEIKKKIFFILLIIFRMIFETTGLENLDFAVSK